MPRKGSAKSVNIRPGVSILSVLRHLNYRPWFAVAEFIDNALQSFVTNRRALAAAEGESAKLRVEIEFDTSAGGRIVVRDNAAGIAVRDYARAFKPAEVPPDTTGLSEFGMGMKSAACWLASEWSVRTSALGENVERTVSFDVTEIIKRRLEELTIQSRRAAPEAHYTEIVLDNLHKMPQGRTIAKIKEHLASIYRVFLRGDSLELTFCGTPLTYQEPPVLSAPYYRTPAAESVLWRKEIDFDFGEGQRASGFAALREKASVSGAGFALFRRNRLIQGSSDEGYRPEAIFGKSNSYRYQRLFGELHLDGFEVSHTKDGFRWEEHEDTFLEFLHEHLDADPLPLLTQAEEYRVRPRRGSFTHGARAAVERTAGVIERDVPRVINHQIEAGPDRARPPVALCPAHSVASERVIDVELRGQPWRIIIELTTDPAIGEWVSISDRPLQPAGDVQRRCVALRLSLAHPFTDRFGGTDVARIEPLLRLAAAIGLAETAARESGVQMAGTFRRNINELLREALSNP
jgi:Histidine kinase-, DNA gyrase B-, and HSP90-like ATPase